MRRDLSSQGRVAREGRLPQIAGSPSPIENALRMIAVPDLPTLADELEALAESEPGDRVQLSLWYERAQALCNEIRANADLCNKTPEIVWHYLSDADIRLKEALYAQAQRESLADWIATVRSPAGA